MIDKSNEEVTIGRVWYNTPNCISFIKKTFAISSVESGDTYRKLRDNRKRFRGRVCK